MADEIAQGGQIFKSRESIEIYFKSRQKGAGGTSGATPTSYSRSKSPHDYPSNTGPLPVRAQRDNIACNGGIDTRRLYEHTAIFGPYSVGHHVHHQYKHGTCSPDTALDCDRPETRPRPEESLLRGLSTIQDFRRPETPPMRKQYKVRGHWFSTWSLSAIAFLDLLCHAVAFLLLIIKPMQQGLQCLIIRGSSVLGGVRTISSNRSRSKWSALIICTSLLLNVAEASPVTQSDHVGRIPVMQYLPLMTLVTSMLALTFLVIARHLAPRQGPIRVWGCVMAGSAYAWLMIRNDPTATLFLSTL